MNNNKDKRDRQKGMTLLELLVSMFVLTIGISGIVGLMSHTIIAANLTATEFQAVYLAKEGIEIVRNVRDGNWVRNQSWLTNIPQGTCLEVVFNSETITSCATPSLLNFDGTFYTYAAGTPTIFRRQMAIALQEAGTANEHLRVQATVSWELRGASHNITVVNNLYDWR